MTNEVGVSVINALNADYVNANDNPEPSRGFYFHYTLRH